MGANERIPDPGLLECLETPEFLKRREPDAIYMWTSTKRLIVTKDGDAISLSGDDIRALIRFFNASCVEDQL